MIETTQLKYGIVGIAAVVILFVVFSAILLRAIYWGRYPYPMEKKRKENKRGSGYE